MTVKGKVDKQIAAADGKVLVMAKRIDRMCKCCACNLKAKGVCVHLERKGKG